MNTLITLNEEINYRTSRSRSCPCIRRGYFNKQVNKFKKGKNVTSTHYKLRRFRSEKHKTRFFPNKKTIAYDSIYDKSLCSATSCKKLETYHTSIFFSSP